MKAVKGISQTVRRHWRAFTAGFAFAILCFVGINAAMESVSKSEYCGGKCHEMNTAYSSWELSEHGANKYGVRAQCIDCHLPPKDKYFTHLVAKAHEGMKDTYQHYFGGEYDVEKIRQRVLTRLPNSRCTGCHDDLLGKPGSSAARMAHTQVLNPPADSDIKCIQCHEQAGHQRVNTLFSP